MIRQHVDAILSAVAGSVTAYLPGDVPATAVTPYVVVIPSAGHPDRDTLAGARSRLDLTFQVSAVGASAPEALEVADRARSALLDVVLPIAGRRCWPIVHGDSQPAREDDLHIPDGTGRPLVVVVDTYGLASVPAIAS